MFSFTKDIGMDLGTASVLIYIKDKGIVLNEPSVVALDKNTGKLLKVGADAQAMLGRTPGNIIAIRPLREGVISDYEVTERMIKEFLHKVMGFQLFKPRIIICVPSGITEVEERAVIDAGIQAGARRVYLIEEPVAAAIGAGIDITQPEGHMIIDIGGGTSDIAVISLSGVVESSSIKIAGDQFNEAVVKYMRRKHNLLVGERTAEKGYQKAIVYQTGGKSEAEEGGGVCQVASTIYTACLYADLKVTERAPHMFTVTYVQLGMDATIYWGSLDYKFVNSTDHPLRIDASVSGGYVHVKLVGTAPKDKGYDHIVLRHEVVATVQPKMEIDGDKTIITDAGTALDENGNTVNIVVDKDGNKYIKGDMVQYSYVGKTVMAYRDYVDANGTVIKTETLHKDTYQSRNTTYKCTPYVEPEVPEEPDPIDPDYPDNPDDPTEPDDPINPWD